MPFFKRNSKEAPSGPLEAPATPREAPMTHDCQETSKTPQRGSTKLSEEIRRDSEKHPKVGFWLALLLALPSSSSSA
eukprot:4165692-Pyramimonas_sp.AAC.1